MDLGVGGQGPSMILISMDTGPCAGDVGMGIGVSGTTSMDLSGCGHSFKRPSLGVKVLGLASRIDA